MTLAGQTVAVELTPRGRAAVAVVLVAGSNAVRLVGEHFAALNGRPLTDIAVGRIALGHWGGSEGEELIVCRRTDTEIEIHCHGGTATVQSILRQLVERGCAHMTWQEWMRGRASDPLRADAQIALAEAPTERSAAILLDQIHGALSEAFDSILSAVGGNRWAEASKAIDRLLSFGDLGLHLTIPWRVVLAGPPNVGKSSLINAIAGYQRAIVSPFPGTTRDVVTVSTAIDGWPVLMADTAGLRASADELEAAGVALAAATLADADLAVIVHDVSIWHRVELSGNAAVQNVLAGLGEQARTLPVLNKMDLLPAAERGALPDMLATSAVTGEGVAELIRAIGHALVPSLPNAGEAVPYLSLHLEALESARAAVTRRDTAAAEAALQSVLAPQTP